MKPGATISPVASKTSASAGAAIFPIGATSLIFSPSSRTSSGPSVPLAGSMTRPFLIRSMGRFLGFHFQRRMRVRFRCAVDEEIQNRHAHRNAVGDLLEHARARPIGDLRGDLDAPI